MVAGALVVAGLDDVVVVRRSLQAAGHGRVEKVGFVGLEILVILGGLVMLVMLVILAILVGFACSACSALRGLLVEAPVAVVVRQVARILDKNTIYREHGAGEESEKHQNDRNHKLASHVTA